MLKPLVADALSRLEANFSSEISFAKQKTKTRTATKRKRQEPEPYVFPISPKVIAKKQTTDKYLLRQLRKGMTEKFSTIQLEGVSLTTINGLIYIPQELQHKIVAWYHQYLAHPGQSRMEATIRQNFTWPNIRDHVKTFCATCPQCQINKRQRKKYGHLPAKEAEYLPWERVNVDLIGPYTVRTTEDSIQELRFVHLLCVRILRCILPVIVSIRQFCLMTVSCTRGFCDRCG